MMEDESSLRRSSSNEAIIILDKCEVSLLRNLFSIMIQLYFRLHFVIALAILKTGSLKTKISGAKSWWTFPQQILVTSSAKKTFFIFQKIFSKVLDKEF